MFSSFSFSLAGLRILVVGHALEMDFKKKFAPLMGDDSISLMTNPAPTAGRPFSYANGSPHATSSSRLGHGPSAAQDQPLSCVYVVFTGLFYFFTLSSTRLSSLNMNIQNPEYIQGRLFGQQIHCVGGSEKKLE